MHSVCNDAVHAKTGSVLVCVYAALHITVSGLVLFIHSGLITLMFSPVRSEKFED